MGFNARDQNRRRDAGLEQNAHEWLFDSADPRTRFAVRGGIASFDRAPKTKRPAGETLQWLWKTQ